MNLGDYSPLSLLWRLLERGSSDFLDYRMQTQDSARGA
jgi:hypothetical protein